MNKLEFLAMFMSILIIMIPVCFAADSISITKVSGEKDIWDNNAKKGYIAQKDFIKAEIEAQNGTPNILDPNLINISMGDQEFDSNGPCVLKQGSTTINVCTYQTQTNFWGSGGNYLVNAKICQGDICTNAVPVPIIVDVIGPNITTVTAKQNPGEVNVTVTYSVHDYAYDITKPGECSGIDKVEFYNGDTPVDCKDTINQTTPCDLNNRQISCAIGGTGNITLTLKAFDKVGNEGDTVESNTFTTDHSEPLIVDGSLKILDSAGNKINSIPSTGAIISAEILLDSNDAVNPIAYADFSTLSTEPTMNNRTGSCVNTSTTYYTCRWTNLKLDKTGDGSSITISAKDSYGNMVPQHPSSYPINIENTAPVLDSFTFLKENRTLHAVGAIGDYADVYANFTDLYPGVDTRQVFANFSALGGNANMPVSNCDIYRVCTQVDNSSGVKVCIGLLNEVYACVWKNVFVKVTETTTATITFDVSDKFGNKREILQTWDMQLDNIAPVIKQLGVGEEHVRDSKNWLMPAHDTNLTALIDETGSGIDYKNVMFKYAGNDVPATNCTEINGGYDCFAVYDTSSSTGTVNLGISLTDNVGNSASNTTELIVDKDAPINKTVSIYSENPLYFKAGQQGLTIIAELDDMSGFKNDQGELTPVADLSSMFTEADSAVKPTDCTFNTTGWTCKWEIQETISGGNEERDITINFTDVAGNTNQYIQNIVVRDNVDAEPDFFRVNIKKDYIMPIEKFTIQYIAGNYIQLIPFDLIKKSGCADAEAYNWRMAGSCTDSLVYMQKKDNGDYVGFIQLALTPSTVNITKQDYTLLNCRLEFTSRCGKSIYSIPEEENINISIPIVSEFERPDDQIVKKVEAIKKSTGGSFLDFITSVQNVIDVANNVCTIKSMISTLSGIFKAIRLVLGGIANAYPAFSGAYQAVQKVDNAYEGSIVEVIMKVLDMSCGIVMCEAPSGVSGSVKYIAGGYCSYLKDLLASSGKTGAIMEQYVSQTSTLELCKRSFIFSLSCFCIPGIVYNINKWRQLECWKGVCYRDYTAAGSMTMDDCDKQSSYDYCVFFIGQFTAALFPIEDFFKMVADMLKNPISYAVSGAWSLAKKPFKKACKEIKDEKTEVITATLSCLPYGLMMLTEAIASFAQQVSTLDEMKWEGAEVDYCGILNKSPKSQDGT